MKRRQGLPVECPLHLWGRQEQYDNSRFGLPLGCFPDPVKHRQLSL
jgi:hypothetical protein